ncbi:hypothetical protein C1645_839246 [Glomus cerebriforme]|uniref:Uncharacterized protein n=1 Tax=Glomus cerebriforme TaxID=658196 RepID=A0A397S130_9GLOM|nr:hypothetical protein C1645_839246 [Glomus cerebriforme]
MNKVYWNELTRLLSKKFWFPSIDSNSISFSETVQNTRVYTHPSWFSTSGITKVLIKNPKSFSGPSNLTNKIRRFLESEKGESKTVNKPNTRNKEKEVAGKCTQCLHGITKENIKRTKKDLRLYCLNANAFTTTPELRWVLDTPYDIHNQAMDDLLKAYNSTFATGIKSSRPIPLELGYDSRLIMNRLGPFIVSEGQRSTRLISLDPGVRTFITGYSPDGYTVEWGKGNIDRIHRLCGFYDKLQNTWPYS